MEAFMKKLHEMNKEEKKEYNRQVRQAIRKRDWTEYKKLQELNIENFKRGMKESSEGLKKDAGEVKSAYREMIEGKKKREASRTQIVKTYKNSWEFQRDSKKMLDSGWMIVNQTSHKEKYSITRGCLFGFLFLPLMVLGRGNSSIIVTYGRADGGNLND